ncbi:hypothetical protein PoB_005340000 [Plakobranchus ocellatus]|uniref:MAM domain-containing protein n=1 Tax=Plakobranchus ocellatus TaxID=259542 RepID=A0AAV4C647_9GAST|nr:hypothetical protein PoB_005340000 [Plakobranchus ocellatus]
MKAGDHTSGEEAVMTTGPWILPAQTQGCLQLFYFMYGYQIGSLTMVAIVQGKRFNVFTLRGAKGNSWKEMRRTLKNTANVDIEITHLRTGCLIKSVHFLVISGFFYSLHSTLRLVAGCRLLGEFANQIATNVRDFSKLEPRGDVSGLFEYLSTHGRR